jgi:hypothetical protein
LSLDPNQAAQAKVYQHAAHRIKWYRPSQVLGNVKPSLWGSTGVSPKVTRQGNLGDCWLLSAASSLALEPARVKKMFNTVTYSDSGSFVLNLYVNDTPINVAIDDRVAVKLFDG